MFWILGLVGLLLAVKQSGQTSALTQAVQAISGRLSPHGATRPTTNTIATGNGRKLSAGVPGAIGGPRDYPGTPGPPGIFVPFPVTPGPAPARPNTPMPPIRYDAPPPSTVYIAPESAPPIIDAPGPIYIAPVPPPPAPVEPRERLV